jgi:hypothetical protein
MARINLHELLDRSMQRCVLFIKPKRTVAIRLCCKKYKNVYNCSYIVSLNGLEYQSYAGNRRHGYGYYQSDGGCSSNKGTNVLVYSDRQIIAKFKNYKLVASKTRQVIRYTYIGEFFKLYIRTRVDNPTWNMYVKLEWDLTVKYRGITVLSERIYYGNKMNPQIMVKFAEKQIANVMEKYKSM